MSLLPPVYLTRAFRDRSLRFKLSVIIVLSCSLALLLAGGGFVAYDAVQNRKAATREISALADMGATGSTAALTFGDMKAEKETLAVLRADPRAMEAAVYNQANRLFAMYRNPGIDTDPPPAAPARDGAYFRNGALLLFRPITLQNERVGTFMVEFSMRSANARLWRSAGIIGLLLIGSLIPALLVAAKLQNTITGPIAYLSGVARLVSAEKDYSVRAEKAGNDETGVLIESFNEMLSQIESHEVAREAAENALRDSEERYALAALGANDGLWDWKIPSGEIYFSSRWVEMLGYSSSEIKPDPKEWFSRIHPGDRDRVMAEIAGRGKDTPPVFSCEYRIIQKNGLYIWVLCRGIVVRNASGAIVREAGSQTDITEGKVIDALTGLRTRLYFIDKLEAAFQTGSEGQNSFAVLFLDLDRFKVVNDSLGHEAGDRLLIAVAGRLQTCIRATDILARNAAQSVIARFGGDEFAILLRDVARAQDASAVAERIIEQLNAPFYLEKHPVFVRVSIGIALGDSGKTPEDLLRNADAAMYHAKNKGKARWEVFDESIRDRAIARMELETDLRKAVETQEFTVYYQPEVSLLTGKTVGFEALVRWNHPRRGLLLPSEFIPIAEETGLIIPIGRWVLKKACRQMAKWHRSMPSQPLLSVSVNMSLKQLADPGFADDVAQTLVESGINPPSLKLELTESSIMENPKLALNVLRRLKELKVGLELDDFGTGYSSLSYLHQLPFDAVKIDRSFISGMPVREGTQHLVETILGMARSLNLEVVAEGVETKDQRDRLVALGCPLAQGYYFSRPVDSDAAEKTLRRDHIPLTGTSSSVEALAEALASSTTKCAPPATAPFNGPGGNG
ncbi:MAG: EAL domain-containing protein [Bryobacteraceae bacterium]|jgi:diguanylate cyclase (GGDEF)-like protein/PAS domain S-box-containing protein